MIRIRLLFEDVAQANLVTGLVHRIAAQEEVAVEVLVLNAEGGEGRVRATLRRYVADLRSAKVATDLLVVALDANKAGVAERRKVLRQLVGGAVELVLALPDPYIEQWYLADSGALGRVLGSSITARTGVSKQELKAALRDVVTACTGQRPLLGGAEYGEAVAHEMNLSAAERQDSELHTFCQELRSALRRLSL